MAIDAYLVVSENITSHVFPCAAESFHGFDQSVLIDSLKILAVLAESEFNGVSEVASVLVQLCLKVTHPFNGSGPHPWPSPLIVIYRVLDCECAYSSFETVFASTGRADNKFGFDARIRQLDM